MSYFLTDLDPRARVKGSRDALGAQAVWSAAGRPLIGNLTTVTSSLAGFVTLLVGLRLAGRAVESGRAASLEDAFLVWEQMAAYARHVVHGHRGFFGLLRVASRAGAPSVHLSAQPSEQILGNQKSNGVYGNYSSPARASGLLEAGLPARLTPRTAAFVDATYIPRLAPAWGRDASELVAKLGDDRGVSFDLRPNPRLAAVAAVFATPPSVAETRFYEEHLVHGGTNDPTHGRQRRFAALLEPYAADWPGLSLPFVDELAAAAERTGSADITAHLHDIAACESVLAPATMLFDYLLTRDEVAVDAVVDDLREQWGERLGTVRRAAAGALPASWREVTRTLLEGDYPALIAALVTRNTEVMRERGGAMPWVEITAQRRVRVRFRQEPSDLFGADTVAERWVYPYFIPSVRSVLAAVHGGAE
ncbi:hypothetical protein [Dactylosporangium salmoneum]|uniref:Uncharacterized protein n=1 Tax=Dactylosporangium salmoneum TaxID=53361 RepID=A0ABN3FKL3_9ACTN